MTIPTDSLVVVNGPEDGTEFPIVRTPFDVGRAPGCTAYVTLDVAVQPQHARVWAVSDGYRVRRSTGCAVYVDGRRAGRFRSRILRSGGIVQVGHTLLALQCAPDGLASRSHGLATQSDLACLLQWALGRLFGATRSLPRIVAKPLRYVLGSKLLVVAVLVGVYLFYPPVHNAVGYVVNSVWQRVLHLLPNTAFP